MKSLSIEPVFLGMKNEMGRKRVRFISDGFGEKGDEASLFQGYFRKLKKKVHLFIIIF